VHEFKPFDTHTYNVSHATLTLTLTLTLTPTLILTLTPTLTQTLPPALPPAPAPSPKPIPNPRQAAPPPYASLARTCAGSRHLLP
jgi:hypothetical protein